MIIQRGMKPFDEGPSLVKRSQLVSKCTLKNTVKSKPLIELRFSSKDILNDLVGMRRKETVNESSIRQPSYNCR